jgi:hypothetical protein
MHPLDFKGIVLGMRFNQLNEAVYMTLLSMKGFADRQDQKKKKKGTEGLGVRGY